MGCVCLCALQVSGIIVGMLLMGFIADQIGRKWGSVLTAAFMFVGGIMLTASNGTTIQGWAIMFAVSQVCLQNCARRFNVQCKECIFACNLPLKQLHDPSLGAVSHVRGSDLTVACSAQFIFGYGVGGEYPLASSSAAERAEANKALRFRRGEMVVCTFSMQVGACLGILISDLLFRNQHISAQTCPTLAKPA